MKNNSVKPVKKTKVSKEKKNSCSACSVNFSKGLFMGFILGFVAGAGIVAVYDYFEEKHNEVSRIKKGSDADYYYNTTD